MDYQALRTELLNDPVALGYAGQSDEYAAGRVNATDTGRTLSRTAVPTSEVLSAVVVGDWPLPGTREAHILSCLLGVGTLDMSQPTIRNLITAVFPAATVSRANIIALSNSPASRAEELGLETVTAGDVQRARAGVW